MTYRQLLEAFEKAQEYMRTAERAKKEILVAKDSDSEMVWEDILYKAETHLNESIE
jgi:hypothetical protein